MVLYGIIQTSKNKKKGELMTGWEIAAVVLVVYWLMNK